MSVQIFLQGKILGTEEFLMAPIAAGEAEFAGRSGWITLLGEILPRALLAELGLSKILLGSSGGGQFLAVLPSESRERAEAFLAAAAGGMREMSGGRVALIWACTENLGDWSVVRKRLTEVMQRKRGAPAAAVGPCIFAPGANGTGEIASEYFAKLAGALIEAETAGWSPESPAMVLTGEGKHTWTISGSTAEIPFARHVAQDEDGKAATASALGARSEGAPLYAVLRGDVDNFGIRLRRAQSVEEHIKLSVVYKQFFGGELGVLCSQPDYWRKATILYTGGDDFAVFGAWDALVALGRELQRLFHRLAEENLTEFPGPEGKTISMAIELAKTPDEPLEHVFERAGDRLEVAKSSAKDGFALFGRSLEWRQMGDAAELKDTLVRMVREFGVSPRFLPELATFYRESAALLPGMQTMRRGKGSHFERPWRIHRRLNRVLVSTRHREFQKIRTNLISELIGKGTQVKLRPAGRVALEWARLAAGEVSSEA